MGMITFFFLMIYSKKLETNRKIKLKVDFLLFLESDIDSNYSNVCLFISCRTKNFLNSLQKEISLTKKLSMLPNTPPFSKYFYEFVFLIQKCAFLELPLKNQNRLFISIVECERHLLLKTNCSLLLILYLLSKLDSLQKNFKSISSN